MAFIDITCPECQLSRKERKAELQGVQGTSIRAVYAEVPIHAGKDIRVLTIRGDGFEDQLECQLRAVSLAAGSSYTALSYCWEDVPGVADVTINGYPVTITKSLELALRYMRHSDEDVNVWADGISINQDDPVEKSLQVQLMGQVYTKAACVWIWLGEARDKSDRAMDLLKDISEMQTEGSSIVFDAEAWKAVRKLFQRPWWGRLWVVQEAILARKATVNCGRMILNLEHFVRCKEVATKFRTDSNTQLASMFSAMVSPFGVILMDWERLKGVIAKDQLPLFQMLTSTGGSQCTVPVDKIYGVLGLASVLDRTCIPVNYEVCTRCLLMKVAKSLFLNYEIDKPLKLLQVNQATKKVRLPSWVPDFTRDDFEDHLMVPPYEGCVPYMAGADNAAWGALGLTIPEKTVWSGAGLEIKPDHNSWCLCIEKEGVDDTLVVCGLFCGFITFADKAPWVPFYEETDVEEDVKVKKKRRDAIRSAVKRWLEYALHRPDTEPDPYQETCGREKAFWRTLIADRDQDWMGPPSGQDFGSRFNAWMDQEDDAGRAYTQPFADTAVLRCLYRSFVVTDKGHFGLGRSTAERGDIVCVLKGGSVPFTLRPTTDKGFYTLVGETYVHGIMDGSFVREAKPGNIKVFRLR